MLQSTRFHAAAALLAAAVTGVTFIGANALATQRYAAADTLALAQGLRLEIQHVLIVGHRRANP